MVLAHIGVTGDKIVGLGAVQRPILLLDITVVWMGTGLGRRDGSQEVCLLIPALFCVGGS